MKLVFDDPRKELPYSGVYRWVEGKLQLLTRISPAPTASPSLATKNTFM